MTVTQLGCGVITLDVHQQFRQQQPVRHIQSRHRFICNTMDWITRKRTAIGQRRCFDT